MNGAPSAGTLAQDPGLLPLDDYGGPTPTRALTADSLAIDHGSNPGHFSGDQRGAGYPRVFGAATDISARSNARNRPSSIASSRTASTDRRPRCGSANPDSS